MPDKPKRKLFSSEYFKDADDLVNAKNDSWRPVSTRRARLDMVRAWTNMIVSMTEEEREELNRTEITNFGLAYRAAAQNESMFTSMVTGTNELLEVIVDTDNPEEDVETGQRISEAINRGAIHRQGKFLTFWRKVAGEITIAGGCPLMMPEKHGWLPELRTDMYFPPETELDAEQVTYAFDPVELSMYDLQSMLASIGDKEDGQFYYKGNLEYCVKGLKQRIKEDRGMSGTSSHEHETTKSVRDDGEVFSERYKVTVPAWWYYEVKYRENGSSYVSATLFTDSTSSLGDYGDKLKDGGGKNATNVAKVICYIETAYETPADWLRLAHVDSEISGVKNMDTLRGVAELIFPSSVEMEELFGLQLEGDKERAKPFWRTKPEAVDAALKWNQTKDRLMPDGIEPVEMPNGHNGVQTPISMLMQNVAGLTASPVSNTGRDQELRQQAIERQQNNGAAQNVRLSEAYVHLDAVLDIVVHRILTAPVEPGTKDYNDIMWIRAYLKRYNIDFKKVAEREYGRFKWLTVRAKRISGGLDRASQIETSEWLVKEIAPQIDPALRPTLIKRSITLRTQDPDLADFLVRTPKLVINQQKLTAENECDTILRRAPLGQVLPTMPGDVHQDHIPIHLLDMQALIARHDAEPWKRLDVLRFAGLAQHTTEHLEILLSNPATNAEARPFLRTFQMLTAEAGAITKLVEEQEGSEVTQLSAKEQADIELKWAEFQLKAQQFGLKVEDTKRLWENREARAALTRRSQYAREVDASRRDQKDSVRLALDAKKTNAQVKSASKKPPSKAAKKKAK